MNRRTALHQPTEDYENRLETARRMLQPIADLLLGKVSCPAAVCLLKQEFIEAAQWRIGDENHPEQARGTLSRLALLTGLDARAVSKILEHGDPAAPDAQTRDQPYHSPVSDLLGMWSSHPDWLDPDTGQPRVVPVYGQGLTFQTLVNRSIGKSISYSVVMAQLLESGNIRHVHRYGLKLVYPFERVADTDPSQMQLGSVNHLDCLGRNIMHKQTAPAHSAAQHWPRGLFWNCRIPQAALKSIRRQMRALLEQHGREIDAAIEAHAAADKQQAQVTAGVGWYYWETPDDSDRSASSGTGRGSGPV